MLVLPSDIMALLVPFAPLFSSRIWRHVPLMVAGAILAPGRRMVSSVLRVVGLGQRTTFQTYHRVLNRAVWSSLGVSRILFGLLINTCAPDGPLIVGIDETIERRRGQQIGASGIYRDPVRSSHSHFVKVRGLRTLDLRHAVRPPPVGRSGLGLPVSHGACPLGACCCPSAAAVQAAHCLGTPTDPAAPPLGARASTRRRG
jgi:DDE superfamily endonuclease